MEYKRKMWHSKRGREKKKEKKEKNINPMGVSIFMIFSCYTRFFFYILCLNSNFLYTDDSKMVL